MLVITKADVGGAQKHVLQLLSGMRQSYRFVLVTGARDYLTREALSLGVEVSICPFLVRPIKPMRDLRALLALNRLINQYRPAVIHAHSFKAGLVARLAALRHRIPAIYTAHGWSFTPGAPTIQRTVGIVIEFVLCRAGCTVLTVSKHDFDLARRFRVGPDNKRHLVCNAADRSALTPRPADTPVNILSIGRATAVKNQSLLIEVLETLPRDVRLTIVGDGNCHSELREQASVKGLSDRIDLPGEVTNIEPYFEHAQIFVLSSRYEGLPLSILEAMAAGLPVVSTDVGGVSEAVIDGQTGLLVPREDRDALSQGLMTLIQDPEKRQQMGIAGKAHHAAEFTVERFLDEMQSIYLQVLTETRRNRGQAAICPR